MGWWNTNSGSLIGAGASLIGGWLGMSGQRDANKMNVKLQQRQQAYETQMSNTAVQRRADDIQAAGGNRALAFTGGQEASTPSVAPAQMQNENVQAADSLANLGPRWVASQIAKQEIATSRANQGLIEANTTKAAAETAGIRAATLLAMGNTGKAVQETENLKTTQRNLDQANTNLIEELKGITTSNKLKDFELKLKNATFEDAKKLIANEAEAAKLGIAKRDWEELVYKWLNRFARGNVHLTPSPNYTKPTPYKGRKPTGGHGR